MGGKRSTSTSQVSIPPEVLARYNAVNTRAEDVASNPFKQYGTTAEAFVAPINQQQQAGISNVNASAGLAQPYINAATGATAAGMGSAQPGELDISKYMNPYQQQVIDATMKQMGQANEQAQSGALGTAVSSGAFGGDRAGIAAANLANQQGMAMGSTLAGLNAQNYGQAVQTAQQQQGVTLGATQADLARLLSGGGQLANLGTTAQTAGLQGAEAQINAGTLEQQTEQAGKTALVNQFMQEQGYPFQVAQFLANIAMGTGSLSGSTTTSTQPAPFFSDRRLKEDVKRIGKTDDGLPIYKFKYKGDDSQQTHVGFMADEVEQKKPEAVGLHPSGYKTVDYDKATRSSMGGGVMPGRAGQGFADGGVAGPYGSSPGSQVDFGGYVPQAYLPVGDLMVADPNVTNAMRQSFAEQLAAAASMGEKLQSMESTWDWAKNKWGSDEDRDAAREAEAARGVAYAYGGAAYLKTPSGGLVPNSAKTYLSDTLESQSKGEKPELKTADAGGGSGKSPAENIADLGKMAMMFLGMNSGGRVGYQDGGTPEEERMRRLREMEPGAATGLLPSGRVPDADRISDPVSYAPQAFDFKPIVSTASGTPRAYEYDQATGLVRDSATNQYITNAREAERRPLGGVFAREGNARDVAVGDINAQRASDAQRAAGDARRAEDMFRQVSEEAARQGSSQSPQAQFPDLYRRMVEAQTAADAARNTPTLGSSPYSPPSEAAMRGAEPIPAAGTPFPAQPGLIPAAGTPLAPSGGLIPAAGTPLPPSGGLVPAAGTPFPADRVGPAVSAPTLSTSAPTGLAPPGGDVSPTGFVSAPDQIAPAPEDISNPFQYSLDFVFKHEGGYTPDDAGAGPTKYGINSRAHPGLDIENLTREQAAEIYKNEYWNPINGDELAAKDPQLARAVFDTAVNSGVSRALDLLERSGGDTQEFLRLRADFLNGLIERNPEKYGQYANGWGRRVMELGGPGLNTSYGEAGVGGYRGESGGLGRAMLTSDKPYEDRSMVGKMFYDEKGNLNRNAVMSAISGIGAMLSSPSQFFLPSLGLGLQGFAGTYAGLEKQAADVGLTRAQEDETRVRTDVSRFFTVGAGGMPMVVLGPGRSVTLDQYLSNPQMFSTGNPEQDAQILAEARNRSSQPAAGGASSGAVFQSPVVQDYIQGEASAANMNYAGAQERSAEMYAGMEGSAEAARASRASMLLQTDAVANLVSPNEVVRSGALGQLKVQAVRYANELLRLGGYEPISGADDAQIAEKAAIAASLDRASGGGQQSFEALNALLVANPNVQNEPEANAKLMATLMLAQQRAVDMAEFAREYRNDPSNQYKLVTEAPKAFDDVYRRRYLAEEQALKTVILHGYEKPEGWPKSPMEYLMDQSLSAADRNEVIRKTLLSYGYTEDQIAPLTSSGGAIDMARYFGG